MDTSITTTKKTFIESLTEKLRAQGKKTDNPVLIGMIGLVGSGKSFIAKMAEMQLNAVVVSTDDIRVALQQTDRNFGELANITDEIIGNLIKEGYHVIFDSDLLGVDKRGKDKILRAYDLTQQYSTKLYILRVVCDRTLAIERILKNGEEGLHEFFKQKKFPVATKLTELIRRTPHHYVWEDNEKGGEWTLKECEIPLLGTIDTGTNRWDHQLSTALESLYE